MAINTQVILQLSAGYFQRNNPLETLLKSVVGAINNILTFNSKMKLLRYKFSLAQEQLHKMESHVQHTNPYDVRGGKINRAY